MCFCIFFIFFSILFLSLNFKKSYLKILLIDFRKKFSIMFWCQIYIFNNIKIYFVRVFSKILTFVYIFETKNGKKMWFVPKVFSQKTLVSEILYMDI